MRTIDRLEALARERRAILAQYRRILADTAAVPQTTDRRPVK